MSLTVEPVVLLAEALRSGRYEQGRNVLTLIRVDGTEYHCPWGVACQIYPGELQREEVAYVDGEKYVKYDGQDVSPPSAVQEWLLGTQDHEVIGEVMFRNDTQGWTFEELADYLLGRV